MHYKKYSCQSTFLGMHYSINTVAVHAYIMPAPYVTRLIKKIWYVHSSAESQSWNTEMMLRHFTNAPIRHS